MRNQLRLAIHHLPDPVIVFIVRRALDRNRLALWLLNWRILPETAGGVAAAARTVSDDQSPEYLCSFHAKTALERGERLRTLCVEGDENGEQCARCQQLAGVLVVKES